MVRTIISLDEELKAWVDEKSRREKISMTELVKRGLRMLREAEEHKLEELLEGTSGIWPNGDGLEYQIKERDGW
jgi:Arc/MetJ-type ribon-helix-helix transcriptional regulator